MPGPALIFNIDPQWTPVADAISSAWSKESHRPSAAEVQTAAVLAQEGYLTSVKEMDIRNINISYIPRYMMDKLASIVTYRVIIDNLTHVNHLGGILASVRSPWLSLYNMVLSEADTRSLVTAMRDRIKNVSLTGDITLDIEELCKYDGKGRCTLLGKPLNTLLCD